MSDESMALSGALKSILAALLVGLAMVAGTLALTAVRAFLLDEWDSHFGKAGTIVVYTASSVISATGASLAYGMAHGGVQVVMGELPRHLDTKAAILIGARFCFVFDWMTGFGLGVQSLLLVWFVASLIASLLVLILIKRFVT